LIFCAFAFAICIRIATGKKSLLRVKFFIVQSFIMDKKILNQMAFAEMEKKNRLSVEVEMVN